MKRFVPFLATMSLALAGCTAMDPEITSGRDMKLLLDEKGIDCESFDVTNDSENSGEILTCLDGSVKNDPFSFIIWPTVQDRDLSFTDFCLDLKRRGNAENSLIVQETWVAYSSSTFFSAEDLAEELGAEIISGQSFCEDRGLEVALTLSDPGIEACNDVHEIFKKYEGLSIRRAEKLSASNPNALYVGQMISVDTSELSTMAQDLRVELRKLTDDPEVPTDIRDKAEEVDIGSVVRSATNYDNGTSPAYLFTTFPSWYEEISNPTREQILQAFSEINETHDEHNTRVGEFEVELALFNFSLAGVLDACRAYAPFDW